eukprot:s2049_g5.t2
MIGGFQPKHISILHLRAKSAMGAQVSANCCAPLHRLVGLLHSLSGPREKDRAGRYLEAPARASSQYLTEALTYSEKALKRSCCRYGDGCQRGNPMHFVEECHPGDPDYEGAEAVSVPVVAAGAALPRRQDSFDWIRQANGPEDRMLRAGTATLTLKACRGNGYQLAEAVVPLRHIDALLEGTKIVTLEEVSRQLPQSRGWFAASAAPRVTLSRHGTALDAALVAANGRAKVAVLGAASAYHPCGGFRTGGRHALEESMCVQSTLGVSLQRAVFLSRHGSVKVSPPPRVGKGWFCYIPENGAIVSPHVEVFRTGSNQGYAFLQTPQELAAVVSVAMPNKNPTVKDSPLDAPSDAEEYKALLVSKFKVALGAAVLAGASKCVVPGVGCGVFKNDPGDVGSALAEAVRWTPLGGKLEEVILAGVPREFAAAAGASKA